MARFANYLSERAVDADLQMAGIDDHEALDIIKHHCSDATWMIEQDSPIYRGFKQSPTGTECFLVDGSKTTRISQHAKNYYTLIFDNHPERTTWPKRSRSLIATTDMARASSYGRVYAIIPYNGVKIGAVNSGDMWDTELKLLHSRYVADVNACWSALGFSETDWSVWKYFDKYPLEDQQRQYNERLLNDPDAGAESTALVEILETRGFLKGIFDIYSNKNLNPAHTLHTSKSLPKDFSEVWIGGPCVALSTRAWEELRRLW